MNDPEVVRGSLGMDKQTLALMSALIAVVAPTGDYQEEQNSLLKAAVYNFASFLVGEQRPPLAPTKRLTPAEKEFLIERKEALLKTFNSIQPKASAD